MPQHFKIMTKCIWCEKLCELLPGKKYCEYCNKNKYLECCRCRRPLNDKKYFLLHNTRCNSCQRKIIKERLKRETARKKTK